jgi:hypothetical protein
MLKIQAQAGTKKNEALFVVFDESCAKNFKYINSVPYVCAFADCQRQFFNLANWEKHLDQH